VLARVLRRLFGGTKVQFSQLDSNIILSVPGSRPAAPTGAIEGSLTDYETGEALVGATVLVEGTSHGDAADATGQFRIRNVPEGIHTLVFSYIGYQTAQVPGVEVKAGTVTRVHYKLLPTNNTLGKWWCGPRSPPKTRRNACWWKASATRAPSSAAFPTSRSPQFENAFFSRLRREVRDADGTLVQPETLLDFDTGLDFFRFGAFGQVSRSLPGDRLNLSFGLRADGNSFTDEGANLLRTLSPRASASYALGGPWKVNASVGRYYKTPLYTVLGYRDPAGNFANRDSRYIRSDHYVTGVEYLPTATTRFTVEGFYKRYANYPVSVRDNVSLANQGGEFGAIGNEEVAGTGRGRAYGAEFFFQQKLAKNLFAVFSYTYVRSEFTGLDGRTYIPSAWDNRHLVSALLGRKFGRGWEMGLKYRFAGGVPYTPLDLEASRRNYLSLGTGVLDYDRLNSRRLSSFNQFDFRLDKKWNWRRLTLDVYLDVQNAFLFRSPTLPQYTFGRTEDNAAFASTDGRPVQPDGANAIPLLLEEGEPSVLPTIGFIVEF